MTLSIKDHIDQGHYPKDEKGRALVPIIGGGTFVVCATDAPSSCPIVGFNKDTGCNFAYWPDTNSLLPPPPRKVEVKGYALVAQDGRVAEVRTVIPDHLAVSQFRIVELTGSYEQEW